MPSESVADQKPDLRVTMSVGKTTGFSHGGLSVSDAQRSCHFYCDLLGLKVVADVVMDDDFIREITRVAFSSVRIILLEIPNSPARLELLEYRGGAAVQIKAAPNDPGCGHLCFNVDDATALHQKLTDSGIEVLSEAPVLVRGGGNRGAINFYARDPDGYFIEFTQSPS